MQAQERENSYSLTWRCRWSTWSVEGIALVLPKQLEGIFHVHPHTLCGGGYTYMTLYMMYMYTQSRTCRMFIHICTILYV